MTKRARYLRALFVCSALIILSRGRLPRRNAPRTADAAAAAEPSFARRRRTFFYYLIYGTVCHQTVISERSIFARPDSQITHHIRAKYAVCDDGSRRIMSVQEFSQPLFRESGYELVCRPSAAHDLAPEVCDCETDEDMRQVNILRAVRRAKVNTFDIILCNPDLDIFATITISPDAADRTSWDECYGLLRLWLSNRVQRCGLKYVAVPEYHKDGKSIHFHAIFNSSALRLTRARSPTGRALCRKGKPIYNLEDVTFGWTTAQYITGEDSHDKVAKYIYKYMGKQMGAKIGGRYYLHGGRLQLPVYAYADDINDVLPENLSKTPILYQKSCEITQNLKYRELYFV